MFGKILEELIFAPSQMCIRIFALSLCMDTVAVFTHPWCQHIKIFVGNLISMSEMVYMRRMYSHPGEYKKPG